MTVAELERLADWLADTRLQQESLERRLRLTRRGEALRDLSCLAFLMLTAWFVLWLVA